MISKILTFLTLSKSILIQLNNKEKKTLGFNVVMSIFNTILELVSIMTIIYLLLVISGQKIENTGVISYLNRFIDKDSLIMSSSILMISVVLLKTIFQIAFSYNSEKISFQIQNRISMNLYHKFINYNYDDYLKENSARILRILSQESVKIGNHLISPIISIINESLLISFVSLFIFIYDPLLGLFVYVVSLLLIFFFSKGITSRIQTLSKIVTTNNTNRLRTINESFRSFDVIKMFNFQQRFKDVYMNYTDRITDSGFKNMFLAKLPKSIFELSIFIFLFCLIFILEITQNNDLLISYLSILAVSIYKIIPSLSKISSSLQSIQYFSAPFIELSSYLRKQESEPKILDVKGFNIIEYRDISYSYDGNNKVLENINFEIEKNDFIGIYGPSGSGKSTFIKIVCGLLKPNLGQILVDKNKINNDILHNYFSYVPQDPYILDDNIIVNITFNLENKKIDLKKIESILMKVGLYKKFKHKLTEALGDNGIKVSGGQKQRIAIARALFFEKKVIILDESTSSLDPEIESKVIKLLRTLNQDLTIIMISHKMKSLINCNKIFRIEDKKIHVK